jgi:hypothetical protein
VQNIHEFQICSMQWHPVHETLLMSGGYNGSLIYWLAGQNQVCALGIMYLGLLLCYYLFCFVLFCFAPLQSEFSCCIVHTCMFVVDLLSLAPHMSCLCPAAAPQHHRRCAQAVRRRHRVAPCRPHGGHSVA